MLKTIELVGEESFWYLGAFMRAGKLGYELFHFPSILKTCNVCPMLDFTSCEIGKYSKFHKFFLNCVNAGNINAVYYEGLHRAIILGLEEGIEVLEANVPMHGFSTLAVGIFYVCLGQDKEASNVFQHFARKHNDLSSDAIFEMADDLELRLSYLHAPYMNTYVLNFKFPDDEVIKTSTFEFGHVYTYAFEGTCKNCRLYKICCKISDMS